MEVEKMEENEKNGEKEPLLELEGASPSPMRLPPRRGILEESVVPVRAATPPRKAPVVGFKTPELSPAHSHGSNSGFHTASLRSNLMREQRDRDPLFYYEVQKVLGVGSMGSVVLVKKRESVVGGSARADLRDTFRREKTIKDCTRIPICGWIVRTCLWNPFSSGEEHHARSSSRGNSSVRSLLNLSNHSPFQPVNDSARSIGTPDTANTADQAVKPSSRLFAMKSIHLSRVTDESFVEELRNEIRILKSLDHPHIVRAIETFEHRNQIFIIMESCSGGDLYTRDPYTEDEAARIISSILSAVSYMHSKNIIHRDLKYENILFVSNHPKSEIKLIDFGLSKTYGADEELMEGVGTIYTMAPEVLKGNYTMAADLWSVGVIAYMLLSSQMPFYGKKRRHIVELIMGCKYNFKGRRWKRISPQAKAFVEDLLVADPEERLTAHDAFCSNWLNRRQMATVRNPYQEENERAQESLLKYAGYSKLKKVAMMVVAHKSSTDDIGILRKVFQNYDTNKSGDITYDEFTKALAASGYTEEQLRPIFDAVDLDGSGRIRYTEFLAATMELHGAIREEALAEAFDRLDCDDSGFISAENLQDILGEDFPLEEIQAIFAEANAVDGKISYADFLSLWEEKKEIDRGTLIQDLMAIENETCSVGSEDNLEESNARMGFLEGKYISKGKIEKASSINSSEISTDNLEGSRHVGFQEGVVIIPAHGDV